MIYPLSETPSKSAFNSDDTTFQMVGLDEFYVARGQGLSKVFLCQKFRYLLISRGLFRRLLGFTVYDELEAPTGE